MAAQSDPSSNFRNAVTEYNWNFDAVPDAELVACCYWEYARESAFIRQRLQKYRTQWWCPGGGLTDEIRNLWDDMDRIRSIGYAAEVFIRGCTYEPGTVWQSVDQHKPNFKHPEAAPLTGSFPAPWQTLAEGERKSRAHIRTDVEQLQIVPIKLAHWSWAKEIARECQFVSDEQHARRKEWEQKYLHKDAKGHFYTPADAPVAPEFEELRPRTRWGVGETLMVDIAWDCFTNDEIANYFRKWIKRARPKELPKPDDKGRNKARDWRTNLTRLAVMRLLSRYTALDLIDSRRNKFPAIWETKQFAGRKWGDPTKWHDARREAGAVFHKLFPFLGKDDRPLSWQRQTPVK